jgi:hypothetical protein
VSTGGYSSVTPGGVGYDDLPNTTGQHPVKFNFIVIPKMKKTLFAFCLAGLLSSTLVCAQTQRTNLPTIYIQTENNAPVLDKENYVNGTITVKSSDPTEELTMPTGIRGRGNGTWSIWPKKPYRLKLENKISLLNLPAKERSWVLLANYVDKTLIRNAVAFKIGELVGLEFSPSARFVDFYLNGVFQGNYMLTDQVEVDSKRVNVETQQPEDLTLPAISGGYLLEIDGYAGSEPVKFYTGKNMPVSVKYPKDDAINTAQFNYIRDFTQQFENTLFSSAFSDPETGYRAYVDTASLVNWYIACELTGNSDSFWSTYIYKHRDIDKFYFGPLWDFDIAFNNDDRLGDAVNKLMRNNAHEPKMWIKQFWQDPWFRQAVHRRWMQLVNEEDILNKLIAYVNTVAGEIDQSQQLNFQTWNILNKRVHREVFLFPTYKGGLDYLLSYLPRRVAFLTQSFAETGSEEPSPPFVSENFYYTITNKKSNNRITVEDHSMAVNSRLYMWAAEEDNWSQLWTFRFLKSDNVKGSNSNVYQIVSRNSGLAMQGNGVSNNLIQVTPNVTDTRQQWHIVPVNTGNMYGIVNASSQYSINNSNGSSENGSPVIEWSNYNITGSENQQWFLQKAEKIYSETGIPGMAGPALKIYPNPASDVLHIQIDGSVHPAPVFAGLYGIDGQCVYRENFIPDDEIKTIAVRSIPAGMYFLKIQTGEGKLFVEKLLIKF